MLKQGPFQCPVASCHRVFSNTLSLQRHLKRLHSQPERDAAECTTQSSQEQSRKRPRATSCSGLNQVHAALTGQTYEEPPQREEPGEHFSGWQPDQPHGEQQQWRQEQEPSVEDEIFRVIQRCNGGRSLSGSDINALLDLINRLLQRCGAPPTPLTSARSYYAYRDRCLRIMLLCLDTGVCANQQLLLAVMAAAGRRVEQCLEGRWLEQQITVTPEDVPELGDMQPKAVLRYRDMTDFLRTQFSNPQYAQEFVLRPRRDHNEDGERVFSTPETGDVWNYAQALLDRRFCSSAVDPVIAALQLYSDKTLLNMKGLQAHPVRYVCC